MLRAMTSSTTIRTPGRNLRVSSGSKSLRKPREIQRTKGIVGRYPALTPDQAAELATLMALSKLVRKHCSFSALSRRYGVSATSVRTYALREHVHFKPSIGTIAAAFEVQFLSKGRRPHLKARAHAEHF